MENNLAITGIVKAHAQTQPEKVAFIIDNVSVTYGEFFQKVSAAAAQLKKMGITKGSHVLSVANPTISYIICMYAVLGIGGVHIPAENRIPAARLAEIAASVDAKLVIAPEDPQCGVCWTSAEAVCAEGTPDPTWEPLAVSDDCSEIIFTTGTTGKSKGVMLSSHCLEVYLAAINPSFGMKKESAFLVTTPLNHVGGLHRIHQCMCVGCTVVLMDGVKDLRAFFANIENYHVTHTYLPPASVKMLLTLAKKQLAALNGKLEFIYTASAPFPVADIEVLMSLMPNTRLHQGYGSSETGSICNCQYNAPGQTINCLGKPYPGVEVMLFDQEGNQVTEPNKEGFIRSRSGMNMLGYYHEPELTASVLKDGFVYSKDLMYFDEEGGLHFAGRGDDVINIRGFKVAPVEVEDVALKHPCIHDCVCIPYDDRMRGRVVKMLVQVKEGQALDTESITAYLSEKLEGYKVPQIIEQVEEIARTHNGKLNRKEMLRLYSNVQ